MENLIKKYPILGSSENPEQLSLTIKSVLLGLVPFIIAIARFYQLEIVENDLIQFINSLATAISLFGVCYGLIRKWMNK